MGLFDFFKKKKKPEELQNEENLPETLPTEGETEQPVEIVSEEMYEPFEQVVAEDESVPIIQSEPSVREAFEESKPEIEPLVEEVAEAPEVPEVPEIQEVPEGIEAVPEMMTRETAMPEVQEIAEPRESEQSQEVVISENGEMSEKAEPSEKPEAVEEAQEEKPAKKGFFRKLVEGLTKTRDHVMDSVNNVLNSFSSIDEDFYEELEEALIIGDLGVNTAIKIVAGLREKVKERKIKDPKAVKDLLKEELKEQMKTTADAYDFIEKKSVVLVIGVNGVGKTTTIGKLASQYKKRGKQVMLAAADTFRAAAIDQLKEWASRSGVPIVAQGENSDPGAVVFDAIASAKSKNVDILICDTAGRLHNKKNLMAELGKIYRIIGREYPEAHLEVLLVLDSTTGQNALVQAKEFKEMADITGIVLTKLDGTSKGGIAIAISADLKLPVKYIGIGEGIDDLRPFDSDSFVDALFGEGSVKE